MSPRSPPTVVALFVVVTLLATGPLVGVDAVRTQPTTIGDGTAAVSDVRVDTSELRITAGRFGATVSYLRVPDASVAVESVTGRPRLLYQVTVPRLGVNLEAERLLTTGRSGTYRLAPGDRAFPPEALDRETYHGRVQIRVQSFESDTTVFAENVTVRVAR